MRITRKNMRKQEIEINAEGGLGALFLDSLICDNDSPEKLEMFAKATLEKGASVGYHEHLGESEYYYILSGTGEYNDDGKICEVNEGDVTYTPSGHSHGMKNIGNTRLEFIAMIVKD